MSKGDSFGEQALYYKSVRSCSVRAINEVQCLALGREMAQKILGDQIQVITFKNLMKWGLEKNKRLSKLSGMQMERIIECAIVRKHSPKDIVYKKNTVCDKLIIVLEGDIRRRKEEEGGEEGGGGGEGGDGGGGGRGGGGGGKGVGGVGPEKEEGRGREEIYLTIGLVFGDDFILKKTMHVKIEDELYAGPNGALVASIEFYRFFAVIGGTWEIAVQKNENNHEKSIIMGLSDRGNQEHKRKKLKLEEVKFLKKLGQGQFGSVYLGRSEDGNVFALKCISKQQVVDQTLERHVSQEKEISEKIDFPFIMKFYHSLKDEVNIYFVNEFISGMELFEVIREIGNKKKQQQKTINMASSI